MNKENILHKWLNGSASSEEIEELKNSPEYASYMKIADTTAKLEAPESDSEANFSAVSSRSTQKGKVKHLNPFKTILKIAVVFAVIFAGYYFFKPSSTRIETGVADKYSFSLPDASEVVLNSGSLIRYDSKKWNKKRELSLEGEAFFNVKKGQTFKVKTASGIVTVLGTKFNVYDRNNTFLVSCYSGIVAVAYNDTIMKVPAGSKVKIENGVLLSHTNTRMSSPSWPINESIFQDATLTSVLEELERQYPIKLTAKISNANRRFTGSFIHGDLNVALRSICDPLHLAYTIEGESVTIYAKEKE